MGKEGLENSHKKNQSPKLKSMKGKKRVMFDLP